MAVRGVDHDQIDAGVDQLLGALIALVADRGGGGDAQAALLVLAGVRVGDRLLHVLDGDQADAAVLVVDDHKLLDAVLVQQALGLVLTDALADGDQLVLGHQLRDPLARVGGEAHVAIGEDADELAGLAVAAAVHHRDAGDAVRLHQLERVRQRGAGLDGERVHHHAGFEFLHLPDLRGLRVRLQVAVDHAEAAGLRHGDGHLGLGHGVHGRGDDRDVERDFAGDAAADIDVARQHFGQTGLDQHVVEGQCLAQGSIRHRGHRQLQPPRFCGLKWGRRRPILRCGRRETVRFHANRRPVLGWRRSIAYRSRRRKAVSGLCKQPVQGARRRWAPSV